MKGAIAVDSATINKPPSASNPRIIGVSQNLRYTFMYLKSWLKTYSKTV